MFNSLTVKKKPFKTKHCVQKEIPRQDAKKQGLDLTDPVVVQELRRLEREAEMIDPDRS